ncbi:MAG: response regulator [Candidatus Dormibacteraeota bacterium]|uniref:Response regulator n=1 Tax=Candidatus Dormiibacter inghamiae TaxID=3127013 RepID=A0A934K7H3_9BACT|nr:response regulator [Candidatus Dormibacteraeota bacterium]MBJ7607599.1 response regulator [Candidatus Dormibacteraeota bacterium]
MRSRSFYVEDDPMVAEMYRLKLELDGYRVVMAKDGLEGLRLADERSPDLIFLDIRLPAMDGLEVLERLRQSERTRQVPVVILSNYSETDLRERGVKLGALDYLIKSQTTPSRLSSSVQGWLGET